MKYEVEVTSHVVYIVEADSSEEAMELAINGCGSIHIADEVEDAAVDMLIADKNAFSTDEIDEIEVGAY